MNSSINPKGLNRSSYYDVHTCRKCADTPTMTPLEWAQSVLMMSGNDMLDAMQSFPNQFSEAWIMGVDGQFAWATCASDNRREMQSFLLGYVAGRYANDHHFLTPVCMTGDHPLTTDDAPLKQMPTAAAEYSAELSAIELTKLIDSDGPWY